jgi:hypothetical protein
MSEHSIFAPSSAARRLQCPGSVLAEANYPEDTESEEAREGTAAHWALSEMLNEQVIAVGQIAPNGVTLTAEMVDGAEMAYDYLCRELKPFGMLPRQGQIEKKVTMERRIHPQSFGTPDFYAWLTPKRLLIADYKFGRRAVDAARNRQLIDYFAGICPPDDSGIEVIFSIIQPRSFHIDGPIRRWVTAADELRAEVNQSAHSCNLALRPEPPFAVGPECRDCRARHACPKLQAAAIEACEMATYTPPVNLTPQAIAREYRTLSRYSGLLKARLSGLEEQALALVASGAPLPGLRVERGRGVLRWKAAADQVLAIGAMLGINIAKPPEPITPKQAIAAGVPEAALGAIVEQTRGAASLVEDDGSLARDVFAPRS